VSHISDARKPLENSQWAQAAHALRRSIALIYRFERRRAFFNCVSTRIESKMLRVTAVEHRNVE